MATEITDVFPEINSIDDASLRTGVETAWTTAAGINGVDIEALSDVPWLPSVQRELGIPAADETLVDHVRDVTACAVSLSEELVARRDVALDLDIVLAGALAHDVSKLYEYEEMETTAVGDLLGHPHYGVAVVSRAGLPVEIAHIVLSHSSRTAVEPATLEAEVVRRADEVAAAAIRLTAVDDLRDA